MNLTLIRIIPVHKVSLYPTGLITIRPQIAAADPCAGPACTSFHEFTGLFLRDPFPDFI
jgi:hypothetical protein